MNGKRVGQQLHVRGGVAYQQKELFQNVSSVPAPKTWLSLRKRRSGKFLNKVFCGRRKCNDCGFDPRFVHYTFLSLATSWLWGVPPYPFISVYWKTLFWDFKCGSLKRREMKRWLRKRKTFFYTRVHIAPYRPLKFLFVVHF